MQRSKATDATARKASSEEEIDEYEEEEVADGVPAAAGKAHRRDTAESLEQAAEFSSRLTRDMAEVREHKLAEDGEEGPGDDEDVCEKLARCRFEAAAAAEEEGHVDSEPPPVACALETLGTPGDTCAKFSDERAESPFADARIDSSAGGVGGAGSRDGGAGKLDRSMCKNTFRSTIRYESLWGSVNAMAARKKLELEMKVKRKYFEKLYERHRMRRVKEKRRAAAKRRAMRCRDQSKIPQTKDDISVNKAFRFRLNYNRELPYMPSTMDQHLRKFKKPPFKHFHKGFKVCYRHVDEFEKLRQAITKKPAATVTKKAKA